MNIREFSLNLQKVYNEMAETFSAYQRNTGLDCLSGCGRCCQNPDVEASVLEMIPLALKIFDEGKLEEWMTKLENPDRDYCLLFVSQSDTGQGFCGSYNERPSVCRMFGVAGTLDKHGKVTHSICKFIKEKTSQFPEGKEDTPLIPQWSAKLVALDPDLLQKKLPINEAITKALHKVALYAQYQGL